MMRAITFLTDATSTVLGYLAGGLLAAIVVIQIAEILARNILGISLPFTWEYAAYFHICAIFLAAAFTLRCGGHVRVTLFQTAAPRAFELLSTLVGLAISAYLSWALVRFALNYGATGRTSGTVNDVPLVYPAGVVAFGACMLTLQLALRLVQVLTRAPVEVELHAPSLSAE